MFLERVASLGLLHHAPDTNILKEFPLEVRQIISTEVVHYLMESKTEVTKVLSSRAHVIWAMECIGTAFTLPLDQEETMAKAVELYRRWTLEPNRKDCPVAIQEDYQFFLQKLLSHCSLMFGSRTKDPAQLDSQASLCKRVLNIYHTVGKDRSNLTRETWDLFLKLMLGVTDSLLSAPPGQDGLAQRLCSHVLKVLLESWLYSSTNDAAMWGSLLKHSCNWIRFMPTITHWNAFSKALTERSISLLYGPKEGKTSVNIRVEGANEVTTIKLDDELVLYAWHKMLHAIGDPNRIEDPSIFVTAFRGIDTLVNLYLQVGKENEKSYALNTPSGNTILHIFGAWLFHAIKHKHEGFEEGQALAVKALCNIFHKRKDTEYPTIYLSRFFECLHKVLQQDGRVLISAIVHSAPLFSHELPGFRSLIPAYIYALNRILLRKTSNYEHFASQEDVRKACIRILAQILPLPNHFGDTPFAVKTVMPSIITSPASAKDTISPNLPEVDTYTKLKPHLRVLLIEALNNELIPNNVRLLLPLCYQFATEDITSDPGFAKRMIMAIGQKITKQEWSSQCTVDAFQTLGYFASLYSYLQGATEVANYVVFSLAHMFSSSDASAPVITDSAEQEKQMIGALQCITHWLAVDDWLLGFPLCKQAVLRFILSALPVTQRKAPQIEEIEPQKNPAAKNSEEKDKKESKNKKDKRKSKKESLSSTKNPLTGSTTLVTRPVVKERKEIGAKLQEAARWALATLLNLAGTFPLPHGTGTDCRISSLVTEEDLLSIIPNDGLPASQLPANFIRFFATKGALVTVIDRPNNGDPFVTIIIRDRTGRQAWNLRSTPLSPEDIMLISNAIAPPSTSPCVEPFHDLTPLKAQEALVNVFQYLEEWNEDPLCAASAQQASVEQQVLEQSQFNLKQVSCVPPTGRNSTQHYTEEPGPTHIYGDTNVLCKFLQGRLFLSSVGFLSINNQPHFFQIQQSAEFYNALSQLDQEPERECFTLGVCYVKHDQTMEQILSNHGGPSAYQHFLASLGWPIDVKSHTGFLGGLDREVLSTGTVAPYFADFSKEIVFHAPSHMPAISDKDALAQRAKLLHSNYVFILWTEDDLEHYSMAKYPDLCKQSNVHIVIHPLDSALYHVRVYHQNTETLHIGPLLEDSVVSASVLAILVRETAINAHRTIRAQQEDYTHPLTRRKEILESIYERHTLRTVSTEQFYCNLYGPLREEELLTKDHKAAFPQHIARPRKVLPTSRRSSLAMSDSILPVEKRTRLSEGGTSLNLSKDKKRKSQSRKTSSKHGGPKTARDSKEKDKDKSGRENKHNGEKHKGEMDVIKEKDKAKERGMGVHVHGLKQPLKKSTLRARTFEVPSEPPPEAPSVLPPRPPRTSSTSKSDGGGRESPVLDLAAVAAAAGSPGADEPSEHSSSSATTPTTPSPNPSLRSSTAAAQEDIDTEESVSTDTLE